MIVEPLAVAHLPELTAAAVPGEHEQKDPDLWAYLPYGPFTAAEEFERAFTAWRASEDPRHYAIVPAQTGTADGMLALMRCVPAHGVIEIGHVWLKPTLQRTRAATEAFALAAGYAFEVLGHRRLEWKCDALNLRSRRAAQRLGFQYEGTFRNHMVVKGRNRDTAWYAITDDQWPDVRSAFERWLAAENFDSDGLQLHSLQDIRSAAGGDGRP